MLYEKKKGVIGIIQMEKNKEKECLGSQWGKPEKTNCALTRKVKINLGIKLYIFHIFILLKIHLKNKVNFLSVFFLCVLVCNGSK